MKKTVKLLLLTVVCALLLGITASAASSTVATIGKKKYTSLAKAVKAVKKGQTIKLRQNITLNEGVDLIKNTKYTLDLGKKTITFTNPKDCGVTVAIGNVTIKNGTVKNGVVCVEKRGKATITSGNFPQVQNRGTLTIKNVNISNKDYPGILCYSGKTTIKKATVKSNQTCIGVAGGTVNISGGTYKNYDSNCENETVSVIKGTVNISGGNFSSNVSALCNTGGKVTLKKGTFTSSLITILNQKNMVISGATVRYNGSSDYGMALVCDSGSNTQIKKGTISGKNFTVALSEGYSKFTLSGGKVQNSSSTIPAIYVMEAKSSKASIKEKYISSPCATKVLYK